MSSQITLTQLVVGNGNNDLLFRCKQDFLTSRKIFGHAQITLKKITSWNQVNVFLKIWYNDDEREEVAKILYENGISSEFYKPPREPIVYLPYMTYVPYKTNVKPELIPFNQTAKKSEQNKNEPDVTENESIDELEVET